MKHLQKNTNESYNKEERQEEDKLKLSYKLIQIKYTFKKVYNFLEKNIKKNYLSSLSFLTRFTPTPEMARRSFSSASITDLVVLNPA